MGWYVRKSVKIGPFRLNASKSGLGISAGVKGFRVGTGPKGAYVHAGAKGLYYRKSLGGGVSKASAPGVWDSSTSAFGSTDLPAEAIPPEIFAGDIRAMNPVEHSGFVFELNKRVNRQPLCVPFAALAFGAAAFVGWLFGSMEAFFVMCFPASVLTAVVQKKDMKAAVLEYDQPISDPVKEAFERLEKSIESINSCDKLWYKTLDRSKSNPVVIPDSYWGCARDEVSFQRALPLYLKTAVSPYAITLRDKQIYFLPWFILVQEGSTFGVIRYEDMTVKSNRLEFMEKSIKPTDADLIRSFYTYTTKSGAPDLRYKVNPIISTFLYEGISLTSTSGLDVTLLLSNFGPVGPALADSFKAMALALRPFQ